MLSNEYIAGFLDADGSVSLEKRGIGENWSRSPSAKFYNCDKGILEAIQKKYPLGRLNATKPKKANHNVSYVLGYMGDSALEILEQVLPHMLHGKKVERTRLIIEGYKRLTPRNGKYTEDQIKEKLELVEQVMGMTMRGNGAY